MKTKPTVFRHDRLKMTLFHAVVILVMALSTSASVFSPNEKEKIASLMKDVLACGKVPGLTVGVVKNGEVWTRGFGKADLELDIDVDATTTRFAIGSLTKAFTTTLLAMQLEESQGRYTWDSKVSDILGKDFKFIDEERTRETTLKDILIHRTGLNTAVIDLYTSWFHNLTRPELVRYIRFLPSSSPFRDRYEYNNWMYVLAGHVTEILSGESWELTLQKKIVDPLGMTSTNMIGYNLNMSSATVAQPYDLVQNEIRKADLELFNIKPAEPAGAIASTADDMVKWIQFLLNDGKTANGSLLLNSTSLTVLFQPHQILPVDTIKKSMYKPMFPVVAQQFGYGFGWSVGNYKEFRSVQHNGIVDAYKSQLTLYPDLQTGIFISQTGPTLHELLTFYLTDILLGDQPWLNASTVCSFPAPWAPREGAFDNSFDVTNQKVTDVDKYVGRYGHRFAGDATVKVGSADGTLAVEFGVFTATVNTTANDRVFKMDATGKMLAVSHPGNSTMLFPITFKNLQNGKFMEVVMQYPYPLTFRRDVSFYDPFSVDKAIPACTSGSKTHAALNPMFIMFVIVLIRLSSYSILGYRRVSRDVVLKQSCRRLWFQSHAMLLLGFVAHLMAAASADVFSQEQTGQIERFVNDVIACHNVPGLALAAVRENETWSMAFGIADLEKNIPVDKGKTLFGIGSLTKAFTVTQIAMLLSESGGRLTWYSWNSKLTDILGSDLKLFDSQIRKQATLKDILTHRTGLLPADMGLFSGIIENITRAHFMSRLRFLPSLYDFRDQFNYNNWMYSLAGYVVEVLSGESWERNLYRRILEPLGMNETKVLGYDVTTTSERMAQPYFIVDNELMKTNPAIYRISPNEPAGAIASTADDMAKWLYFVIHKGETIAGQRLLSESYFDDMFVRHNSVISKLLIYKPQFPVTDESFNYGYAWFIGHYREYTKIWHSGGLHSYKSLISFYPKFNAGVFVTENGPGPRLPLNVIVPYISDILIGQNTWLNSSTACSFPQPWTASANKSDNSGDVTHDVIKNAHKYIGSYGNRMVGDLTVDEGKNDNSLILKFGRVVGIIKPTSTGNKFLLDTTDDFRLLTHFGNNTKLISTEFKEESNGQFQAIEVYTITFRRDIQFSDPFPPDETDVPCTSLAVRKIKPELILLLLTMASIVMRNIN
ncbi:uncharacterized protein LOC121374360 [Gigantopelta aegis]|uniref:uncharacterized protein LOC121374360 n=1 Tax=Gigantopelta aegis TaxID=1735272 RepID=UPI001B88E3B5|nr:uncharacterized protein LOC121374360 [Gigantopelta aegis]